MNIDDVKEVEVPEVAPEDRLRTIFERQRALMVKYEKLEKENGLLQTEAVPVDLNDRFGQARLKDFAWRITEELTESAEALREGSIHHGREEFADALHFFVEFCILVGVREDGLKYLHGPIPEGKEFNEMLSPTVGLFPDRSSFNPTRVSSVEAHYWIIVTGLGFAMNCLKLKPWKMTAMLTDVNKFLYHVHGAFRSMMRASESLGMGGDLLYDYYFRKSKVNEFRQQSNY